MDTLNNENAWYQPALCPLCSSRLYEIRDLLQPDPYHTVWAPHSITCRVRTATFGPTPTIQIAIFLAKKDVASQTLSQKPCPSAEILSLPNCDIVKILSSISSGSSLSPPTVSIHSIDNRPTNPTRYATTPTTLTLTTIEQQILRITIHPTTKRTTR